nr:ATP-binding cassette domain-containing protein [Faecalibaculum rodentium]
MIDIQNATKTYGDKTAVSDFTAHVESGKITGFIGPNGAGKTTLIRMITGVLKPDAGSVTLDGKNIQTRRWRRSAPSDSYLILPTCCFG